MDLKEIFNFEKIDLEKADFRISGIFSGGYARTGQWLSWEC